MISCLVFAPMKEANHSFRFELADEVVLLFRELKLGEMHIQMRLEFERHLDEIRLLNAMKALLELHPLLACVIAWKNNVPLWKRRENPDEGLLVRVHSQAELKDFLEKGLDLESGAQVCAALYSHDSGDSLVLMVAHSIADAGGTKEIVSDLAALYRNDNAALCHKVGRKFGSRSGLQIVKGIPFWKWPFIFCRFLASIWRGVVPLPSHNLSLPPVEDSPKICAVTKTYDKMAISRLSAYAKKHHATLNDAFVAAMYRALVREKAWEKKKNTALRVQITVDFRRWYIKSGRAQEICNLSAFDYPYLVNKLGVDFNETLKLVSAMTRNAKNFGFGVTPFFIVPFVMFIPFRWKLFLLRRHLRDERKRSNIPPTLTNMGPINRRHVDFGQIPREAYLLVPPIFPPFLGIGLSGFEGSMTLSAMVPDNAAPQIRSLFQAIENELQIATKLFSEEQG